MSGFNYDKFDKIGRDFEEEEKKEKAEVRAETHAAYNKRRQTRIETWESEQRRQGKDVEKLRRQYQKQSCGCMSQQMAFAHQHGDHKHDPKEMLKRAAEKKKNTQPDLPLPERNRRKLIAIEATRVDGGKFFKEGKYETALAIYERGLLISNGIYGIPDKQWEDVNKMEAKLDLNIAACKLKLKEWVACIEYCERALSVEKTTKAYYRMAEAYIGLGEYEKALEKNELGRKRQPDFASLEEQEKRIRRLHAIQIEKAKKESHELGIRLRSGLKKQQPRRVGGGRKAANDPSAKVSLDASAQESHDPSAQESQE